MELVRRDARFEDWEKEIKRKIMNSTRDDNTNIFSISDHVESDPLTLQLEELNIKGIEGVRRIQRDLQRTADKCK